MVYPVKWGWLVGGLAVIVILFSVPGYTLCLSGDRTVRITTPYHFGSKPVQVGGGLPLGTVIATTFISAGSVITRCDKDIHDGVWSIEGFDPRYRMAPTNVDGVGLRVVSEKANRVDDKATELSWRWNASPPLRSITQGGLRIELVKTGPIHPGVVTRVAGEVQYRLYTGDSAHQRLVVVENLLYVGQLVIEVIGAGAVQGHQRLS